MCWKSKDCANRLNSRSSKSDRNGRITSRWGEVGDDLLVKEELALDEFVRGFMRAVEHARASRLWSEICNRLFRDDMLERYREADTRVARAVP